MAPLRTVALSQSAGPAAGSDLLQTSLEVQCSDCILCSVPLSSVSLVSSVHPVSSVSLVIMVSSVELPIQLPSVLGYG